jgi:hypothetical protein
MADQASSTIFSHSSSNELPDAVNSHCKCKLPSQQYLEKTISRQTQGLHYKKLSPNKSRGYSLPLSPLVNNLNIYSKKPPSGFCSNRDTSSSTSIEPEFRIGGETDHYPGRFSFTHSRFFHTLTNPQFSSAARGGLHAEERLDIMSDRNFDNDRNVDSNEPVFYFGSENSGENTGKGTLQYTQPSNSFTNSISRRRKLTQSLSGMSSPGPVRNKLSPVREYVPSTNSNAGSPTTPTNQPVCFTTLVHKYCNKSTQFIEV